jgi:hypothetical protein
MNRRSNIIVGIIIALGAIGLVYTLFTQPSKIFIQLGMLVLFGGVIFLVYKLVIRRRTGSKEYSAYLRAVKQSKRRFNEPNNQKAQISRIGDSKKGTLTKKKTISRTAAPKRKKNSHLTVIEGKKGKKKNRAFF